MKVRRLRETALFLITLFLLGGLFETAFAQQTVNGNDEQSGKFFQRSAREIRLTSQNLTSIEKNTITFPSSRKSAPAAVFPPARQTSYVRPAKSDRFKKYLNRTFGGYALLGDVVSAGFAQIVDEPEEWENNITGFGRRFASTFGRSVITETVTYGLDESFKLDSNFYKSNSKSFQGRAKNAFLSTFTARKADGKRVFGFPRIAGVYTSAIIANEVWYPSRYNYKDGLASGTISLGVKVGVNFLRESF